jgi:hypothetical protein
MTLASGDRVKTFQERARKNPLVAVLIIIGTTIVGTGEVASHWSEILVSAGFKKEAALELSFETARGEFSRTFAEAAWRRLFWTRNYVEKVRLGRPKDEQDYAWNKHLDTVADWSADAIVNINGFEKYYPGTDKEAKFEDINQGFRELESLAVRLRTASSESERPAIIEEISNHDGIQGKANELNTELYFFALNRAPSAGFR